MAATQAPKGFGLAFALVGIPLIIWNASGTNEQLAALDTADTRKASCVAKLEKSDTMSLAPGVAESLCGCIARKAEAKGLTRRYGAYDEEAIKPVVEQCYQSQVAY